MNGTYVLALGWQGVSADLLWGDELPENSEGASALSGCETPGAVGDQVIHRRACAGFVWAEEMEGRPLRGRA